MSFRQFTVLMWKNLLFRRRQYIITSLEILLPTSLFLLILVSHVSVPSGTDPDYDSHGNSRGYSSQGNGYDGMSSSYDDPSSRSRSRRGNDEGESTKESTYFPIKEEKVRSHHSSSSMIYNSIF